MDEADQALLSWGRGQSRLIFPVVREGLSGEEAVLLSPGHRGAAAGRGRLGPKAGKSVVLHRSWRPKQGARIREFGRTRVAGLRPLVTGTCSTHVLRKPLKGSMLGSDYLT